VGGVKLLVEYAHSVGWIGFEVPKWLSLGLIVVIFAVALVYARRHEHLVAEHEASTKLLDEGGEALILRRVRCRIPSS